ncbi:unnamed protein product, partial [marine sediment metagenome]
DESIGLSLDDATTTYDATVSNAAIWGDVNKKIGAGALNHDELYYAFQGTLLDTVPGSDKMAVMFWFRPNLLWNAAAHATDDLLFHKSNTA